MDGNLVRNSRKTKSGTIITKVETKRINFYGNKFSVLYIQIIREMNCLWAYTITANVKVFMKKGEFGTRQPVTGAGFCSKVE